MSNATHHSLTHLTPISFHLIFNSTIKLLDPHVAYTNPIMNLKSQRDG